MLWMTPFSAYGLITGGAIIVTKTFAFKWVVLASSICAIYSGLTNCAVDAGPTSMTSSELVIFTKSY